MKTTLLALGFILMIGRCSAQFGECRDSSRLPDPYFRCQAPLYDPVCGCDNITYRNECAAENWGGLINNGFEIGWTPNTVCGNFDFDINPTAVADFPIRFTLYMKNSGSATLYVYNQMGVLIFTDYFNTYHGGIVPKTPIDYDIEFLDYGIYFAVVDVSGEHITKKFAKISEKVE